MERQPQTSDDQTAGDHHNHFHGNNCSTCINCGGPTAFPPPPSWSDASPPPVYIPIRAPAINLPPSHTNPQQTIMLTPVPQCQKVPTVSPPYHFQTPTKIIHSQDDIIRFRDSNASKYFLGFIVSLSESIRSHKLSDPCHQSPTVTSIISLLETLIQFIDEIPPIQHSARYGNLSFRAWHTRMTENSTSFMLKFLPPDLHSATIELVPYFEDSFGNSSRIDYGTGHETNFAAWLYCLARIGIINEEDYQAVVSRVFVKYLELMRKLQLVYSLEPAGSHGVWGLDDYHFLPFIFGSSQLIDHKYMKPKSIHNEDIIENFSNEYLYLSCIAFVKKMKKGLFAEHSPLLDDISGVPNWNKVNSGLLKMYKVEVMEKVPIMQHFLFGWLIKCHGNALDLEVDETTHDGAALLLLRLRRIDPVHSFNNRRPLAPFAFAALLLLLLLRLRRIDPSLPQIRRAPLIPATKKMEPIDVEITDASQNQEIPVEEQNCNEGGKESNEEKDGNEEAATDKGKGQRAKRSMMNLEVDQSSSSRPWSRID